MNKRFFYIGYLAILTLAIIGFNVQSVLADDSIPSAGNKRVLDFDGDGKTDPAVFRNTGSGNPTYFHVPGSTSGYQVTQFGIGDDQVVAFPLFTH